MKTKLNFRSSPGAEIAPCQKGKKTKKLALKVKASLDLALLYTTLALS